MNREEIEAVVARGAQLLDEKGPELWFSPDKLDLAILDVAEWNKCILGQLYGTYCMGAQALRIAVGGAHALGFDIDPRARGLEEEVAECNMLMLAWFDAINKRRFAHTTRMAQEARTKDA